MSKAGAPLAVIVLTKNGADVLEKSLASVSGWADQLFIVDSGSTDGSLEVARRFTTDIHEHPFSSFAAQRNWALDYLPIRHEWVLFLDQDEALTPALQVEIVQALRGGQPAAVSGFYIKRRFIFMNRWLKNGGYYPSEVIRLFRRTDGRVMDAGLREYVVLRGAVGHLTEDMIHFSSGTLSAWTAKHNRYADVEAAASSAQTGDAAGRAAAGGAVVERHRFVWLRAQLWDRLPPFVRPLFLFSYRYFLRLGFLDGMPGLIYCVLHDFWYPFLVDAKRHELALGGAKSGMDGGPGAKS